MRTMNRSAIYISYVRSLLWIALLMAIAVGVALIVELVFVDFLHGNPHRTKANAIFMMLFFPVILGIVTTVGSFFVFTLPQCFQAVVADVLVWRFGRLAQLGVLLALPFTAILAWYCYDYLTPTDLNLGINAGADWVPYQHGLTLRRYLATLIIQTPISLFSLWYCDATIRNASKKWVVRAALALAGVAGVMWGYGMARTQYQFL
jgi:hypothetical protein